MNINSFFRNTKITLHKIFTNNNFVENDFLLSIFISLFLIFVAIIMSLYNYKLVIHPSNLIAYYTLEPKNKLSILANWDGVNYIRIAMHGYNNGVSNFFPLYPIFISLFRLIFRSYLMSALFVSWISMIISCYFYLKIIKIIFKIKNNIEALKGLSLFLLFPTAMFMIMGYSEAISCAVLLGAIYFTLIKRYYLSGILLALATISRIDGIFGLILIALLMIEQKEKITKIFKIILIGSTGIISYSMFLLIKFNKPLKFINDQQNHGWLTGSYKNLFIHPDLFKILLFLLVSVTVYYWWSRKKSFAIYSFLFLLIPLVGGQFGGFNRYVLLCFPLTFMLYSIFKNKVVMYSAILFISTIFWTYYLFNFTIGYIGG